MAQARINATVTRSRSSTWRTASGSSTPSIRPVTSVDNLHPYATGYGKMNAGWQSAFQEFMLTCAPAEPKDLLQSRHRRLHGPSVSLRRRRQRQSVSDFSLKRASGWDDDRPGHRRDPLDAAAGREGDYPVEVQAQTRRACTSSPSPSMWRPGRSAPLDMTSYWPLDETTSGEYVDEISFANATCAGACPSPTAGTVEGAQEFDGATTGLNVPEDDLYDWAGERELLHRVLDAGLGRDLRGHGTDNNEVMVGRDQGNLHWWTGCWSSGAEPAFVLRDTSDSATGVLRGTTSLADGSPHHVVAVHDAALGRNQALRRRR